MPSLYEILDSAHAGEGMSAFGREFGLTPDANRGRGDGASSRHLNGPKAIDGVSGWARQPVRRHGTAAKLAGHVRRPGDRLRTRGSCRRERRALRDVRLT